MYNLEYDDEENAIKKAINKKNKDVEMMTKEDKLKLSAYLYRKGFSMDLIRKYVDGGNVDIFN
jgi:regulatory protein